MIKETRGIFLLLGSIWITIIPGLVIIDLFIVEIPTPTPLLPALVVGTLKVGVSGGLVFLWLYLWNKLVKTYFWRNIKNNTE